MPFLSRFLFWLGDSVPLLKQTAEKVGTLILTSQREDLQDKVGTLHLSNLEDLGSNSQPPEGGPP